MTGAAARPDDFEVSGFPAVADTGDDGGEADRAVARRMEHLNRYGPADFGTEAVQGLVMAISDVRQAMGAVSRGRQTAVLESFAAALATFGTETEDGRRRRTAVEWLKGQSPPIDKFLDRLEALAREAPDVSGRRSSDWDVVAATYQRAHKAVTELAGYVGAGKRRTAQLSEQIGGRGKRDKTADQPPADVQALRGARDSIERQTHLLRVIRRRAVDYLEAVRAAARVHAELADRMRYLDARALPQWEEALAKVARATAAAGKAGRGPVDIEPIIEANARLSSEIATALELAAELHDACTAADTSDPVTMEYMTGAAKARGNRA